MRWQSTMSEEEEERLMALRRYVATASLPISKEGEVVQPEQKDRIIEAVSSNLRKSYGGDISSMEHKYYDGTVVVTFKGNNFGNNDGFRRIAQVLYINPDCVHITAWGADAVSGSLVDRVIKDALPREGFVLKDVGGIEGATLVYSGRWEQPKPI